MRVLIGHNFYRSSSPSGEDTVYRNEVALLTAAGVDVRVVERHSDSIDDSKLLQKIGVALSVGWSRSAYRSFSDVISEVKPDVVHFQNTFPLLSPSVYAACREHDVPIVQTVHNFRNLCPAGLLFRDGNICEECVGRMPIPALKYRCYRGSLAATLPVTWMVARRRVADANHNMVDVFIVPTEFVGGKLIEGGYPAHKIRVKPHFLPDIPAVGSGTGGYAIFVGRLSAEKGVETLLAAWRRIKSPTALYVVGDGPLRSQLESQARKDGLNVFFLGMRENSEVLELIGNAQFLVAPSECYETFGMTVVEAYACGTPVIVSKAGGLEENVVHGVTGWTVNPGNSEELANVIDRLSSDNGWMSRSRESTRNFFLKKFTADKNLKILMDIYDRAIGQSREKVGRLLGHSDE